MARLETRHIDQAADGPPNMLLRVEEVARVLSLSRSKVFLMIAEGELPVLRFGRAVRVSRRELERWIEARTVRVA